MAAMSTEAIWTVALPAAFFTITYFLCCLACGILVPQPQIEPGLLALKLLGHGFEQTPVDGEEQGALECCSPWGCKESNRTE